MESKEYILFACIQGLMSMQNRFDSVREQDAVWIINRLYWHKLLPLAAAVNSTDRKSSIAPSLQSAFDEIQIQNLAREQWYYKQVKSLFDDFQAKKIQFIPYKGPFWGALVYPDYSWRHIGDIDLLMTLDGSRKAVDMMDKQGYELEILGDTRGDDFARRGAITCQATLDMKQYVPVQIHWQLMSAPRFLTKSYIRTEDFFENTTVAHWKDIEYSLPKDEVRFLYHALHATCQHQFNRLVLLIDMANFIDKHPSLDWQAIYTLAKERRCLTPLSYSLMFLQYFISLPSEAQMIIKKAPINPWKRWLASMYKPKMTLLVDEIRYKHRRKIFRIAMS